MAELGTVCISKKSYYIIKKHDKLIKMFLKKISIIQQHVVRINREYYMVARKYEIYFEC